MKLTSTVAAAILAFAAVSSTTPAGFTTVTVAAAAANTEFPKFRVQPIRRASDDPNGACAHQTQRSIPMCCPGYTPNRVTSMEQCRAPLHGPSPTTFLKECHYWTEKEATKGSFTPMCCTHVRNCMGSTVVECRQRRNTSPVQIPEYQQQCPIVGNEVTQ